MKSELKLLLLALVLQVIGFSVLALQNVWIALGVFLSIWGSDIINRLNDRQ